MSEGEVEVLWLSERGEGVARWQNRPLRIPDALPGERVRVSVGRGDRLLSATRLSSSASRVDPGCEYFGACGGCTVRHASPSLQTETREELLRRALRSVAPTASLRFVPAPQGDRWRLRARMQWHAEASSVRIGYFGAGSHRIIDTPVCPVLLDELERALAGLRGALGGLSQRGELSLAKGRSGVVASLLPSTQPSESGYRLVEGLVGAVLGGVALRVPGSLQVMCFGDARPVVKGADGQDLLLCVDGFSQSNEAVNGLLAAELLSQAEVSGLRVFEFHAGAGNFTVALARSARRVTALESDAGAVGALRENLSSRGLTNVSVRHELDSALKGPIKADVVVLDPPRGGAKELAELLTRHPVRRVVYVSCDPATLARDLSTMSAAYEVQTVTGFEMFPQTLHVETVVRMERRAGVLRSRP